MEDFSASLLKGRLVFGKYPTQGEVNAIIEENFTHVVNLCATSEIIWEAPLWDPSIIFCSYPFKDGASQTPEQGWNSFESFLNKIISWLKDRSNKVYIHCLGGHGRSATIAAIIYGRIRNKTSDESLEAVYNAHQKRIIMKDKWRKLGAPQRAKQKAIVKKYILSEASQ